MIGRSGAGYDKIDLHACTEHGVAVFNAPLALNHSTASSALLFMLALAKRLFAQDKVTRHGRWDRQAEVLGSEIFGPHARHRRPGPQRTRAGPAGRSVPDERVWPIRRMPTPRRPRSLDVRLDVARGGDAPVRFREPALPVERGDARADHGRASSRS